MRNILLTGSSGFLGKHIIKDLPAGYTLTCLRFSGNVNKIAVPPNIDCVIHAAALKIGNYHELHNANVEKTKALLEKCSGIKHFIYVSTEFIEAFKKPYTLTKELGEQLVKRSGINYTIIRLPHLYSKEHYGFLNSKFFIMAYNRIKRLMFVKFRSEPIEVGIASKKIVKLILNKDYYGKTVYVDGLD